MARNLTGILLHNPAHPLVHPECQIGNQVRHCKYMSYLTINHSFRSLQCKVMQTWTSLGVVAHEFPFAESHLPRRQPLLHPVSEGNLPAEPNRKITPTTML
jgi:hypothetical protein